MFATKRLQVKYFNFVKASDFFLFHLQKYIRYQMYT